MNYGLDLGTSAASGQDQSCRLPASSGWSAGREQEARNLAKLRITLASPRAPILRGPASRRRRLIRKKRPLTKVGQSGWLQVPSPLTIGSSHAIDVVLAGLCCRRHDLAGRLRRSQT